MVKENNNSTISSSPQTEETLGKGNILAPVRAEEKKPSVWEYGKLSCGSKRVLSLGKNSPRIIDDKGRIIIGDGKYFLIFKKVIKDAHGRVVEYTSTISKFFFYILHIWGKVNPTLNYESEGEKTSFKSITITPQNIMDDFDLSYSRACELLNIGLEFADNMLIKGEFDKYEIPEKAGKSKKKIIKTVEITCSLLWYNHVRVGKGEKKKSLIVEIGLNPKIGEAYCKSHSTIRNRHAFKINTAIYKHAFHIFDYLEETIFLRKKNNNTSYNKFKVKNIMANSHLPTMEELAKKGGRPRYFELIIKPFILNLNSLKGNKNSPKLIEKYNYLQNGKILKIEDVEGYKDSKGKYHRGKISYTDFLDLTLEVYLENYPEYMFKQRGNSPSLPMSSVKEQSVILKN